MDSNGRTIWIADAHRDDGQALHVRADQRLTAFLELESAIRLVANWFDGLVVFAKLDVVWNRGQGRKLFSRSFLPLFQNGTARVNPPETN